VSGEADQVSGDRDFTVRALGEIAIRCRDFDAMIVFYRDVIGLPLLEGFHDDGIVFFSLGESHGGHTAVLALFRHDAGNPDLHPRGETGPETGARSSLHHVALAVDRHEQDAICAWYVRQGLTYRIQEFSWIGWRGIFTTDPDGNTLELVAADPSIQAN
jgi:catechol 2,3-dioxygenase-like lactoylglutathione lyase family enzyme